MKTFAFLAFLFISQIANAAGISVPFNSPYLGKKNSDVQIVEFFDYRCGYCKKMVSRLEQVHQKYPDIEIIFIEYPIFGGASIEMAKAALAVKTLDSRKYFDFHKALMQHRGKFSEESINKIAEKLGLKAEKIIKEMQKDKYDRDLKSNATLARSRAIRGTPHLVVNAKDIRGAISFEDLDEHIIELKSK